MFINYANQSGVDDFTLQIMVCGIYFPHKIENGLLSQKHFCIALYIVYTWFCIVFGQL